METGQTIGILGENGAGKSTLMKILRGIYQPSEGKIFFEGEEVHIRQTADASDLGINMIPQEFNLINTLSVFENIFLGNEPLRKGILDKQLMREKTALILKELQADIEPNARIIDLSVAQKQMVEVAKALIFESKILIMDEPTTVLNCREVEILFSIIQRLKDRGVSIIFISHKLNEIKQNCDRVLILRDGSQISFEDTSEITAAEMARRMVGRELNKVYPRKRMSRGEVIFKVDNLSVSGILSNISFSLKKGEILGVAGLMGSGRTELAESIMGLRNKSAGTISMYGRNIFINHPRDAVRNKLAYLSEDRQGCGILKNFIIPENITLVSLKKYVRIIINKKQEHERSGHYMKRFNIKTTSLKLKLEILSGGNQQKVYLSKWLETEPSVLILDEPTRGIDVHSKMEIYHFIHELTEQGISCIIISSELEEIIGLCHRVLVMRGGALTAELTGNDINEEEIMYFATGVKKKETHVNRES